MKFEAEGQKWGKGSWKDGNKLEGLRSVVSSQQGSGQSSDCFGQTKSPENTSSGCKCHLVSVSRTIGCHWRNP